MGILCYSKTIDTVGFESLGMLQLEIFDKSLFFSATLNRLLANAIRIRLSEFSEN